MFPRILEKNIIQKLHTGKAIIVLGARQVGKTTLIKKILQGKDYLSLNGDDPAVRSLLSDINTEELKSLIGNHSYVFVDEAQRIHNIGLTLKIIVDNFPQVQLLITGSSSLYLSDEINETLTGRKWEYILYPIAWEEYEQKLGYLQSYQQLENRLLYGFYPDVLNNPGEEKEILKNLVDSYLFKDVLALSGLRRPQVLEKLVQALALQIGQEVNFTELASLIGINKNTVQRYIDILERNFIVFTLPSFSKNLRNEIKRNRKIYFYDLGIRNAVIGNFTPLDLRQDKGALWENFLLSERKKQHAYKQTFTQMYFWRTKQQQEIDLVEVQAGQIRGYKFKWKPRNVHISHTFTNTYNAEVKVITSENFRNFVII